MRRWRLVLAAFGSLGLTALLALPLVATATDDVQFCLSCHVMSDQGKSHATSFHRNEATCSDCHTGSLVQKYTDGARHVAANIAGHTGPITLRESSRQVVADQCYSCHASLSLHARQKHDKNQNCLECHKGHDERAVILPGQ